MKKFLALILVLLLFVGACASNSTMGQTLTGGAVGAAGGALIGAGAGSAATGAAIGGGAGLIGGYLYNQYEKSQGY